MLKNRMYSHHILETANQQNMQMDYIQNKELTFRIYSYIQQHLLIFMVREQCKFFGYTCMRYFLVTFVFVRKIRTVYTFIVRIKDKLKNLTKFYFRVPSSLKYIDKTSIFRCHYNFFYILRKLNTFIIHKYMKRKHNINKNVILKMKM